MSLYSDISINVVLPNGRLVAGVSGGVDSMLLLALCIRSGRDVIAVHVNYRKRGAESDADEKFVRNYCKKHNVPLFVMPFKAEENGNFQKLARDFRYKFFEEVRIATDSDFILTAHHSDDNAESLLIQLFRASSALATTGIPGTRGQIYRPLLAIDKDKIVATAKMMEVPWREDHTNAENEYTRNRIRNVVIPELDDLFPGWRVRLRQLKKNTVVLNQTVSTLLKHLTHDSGSVLKRDEWLQLASPVQKLVMQSWVLNQTGQSPTNAWLKTLGSVGKIQSGALIDVHNGWTLLRNRNDFILQQTDFFDEKKTSELCLSLEQILGGTELQTGLGYIRIETGCWRGKPAEEVLELALDSIQFPLTIRAWRAGDRMQPLGMQGSKLISDVLTDAKTDAQKKASMQVAETFDGKICAVIFRAGSRSQPGIISQQFSCRETGHNTLIIAIKNDV